MSTSALLILALGWVACGVLTYGIAIAYFDAEHGGAECSQEYQDWAYESNRRFAICYSLFGPLSLLGSFIASDFVKHGLQYRRGKK